METKINLMDLKKLAMFLMKIEDLLEQYPLQRVKFYVIREK